MSVLAPVSPLTVPARVTGFATRASRGATRLEDRASGTTLVMSTPAMDRALWEEYLDAADASYSRHGVSVALDAARVRDGRDTAVFFAAVDRSGAVVAGVRGQGPYLSAQQSHALVAAGYRGAPLRGVPFDEDRGTVRNQDGRVTREDGSVVPRTYVVGWAKRGATGGIGDNKADAEATVDAVIADSVRAGAGATGRARRRLPLLPVSRRS